MTAPASGRTTCAKPGRVLTICTGEMLRSMPAAEKRYWRSIHASSVSIGSHSARITQVGTREAESAQSGLDLGQPHEQLPKQSSAVILDHHDDGRLVDRQVRVRIPLPLRAERID